MFAILIGTILTAVILILVLPFLKQSDGSTSFVYSAQEDQDRIDLEIEKESLLNSLSELQDEKEQGKFGEEVYLRLKATDEHRLAGVLGRLDQLTSRSKSPSSSKAIQKPLSSTAWNWASAISLGIVVLASSTGIYFSLQWKENDQRLANQRNSQGQRGMQGMPDPLEMVARLEGRLKENPNDVQGQIMAGRSYQALERWEDSKKAWKKVLELEPKNDEAHFNLGAVLINSAEPGNLQPYQRALEHLEIVLVKFPREPALLWYQGVAFMHLQRFSEADESWTTAYQNLVPGTQDAQRIKQALKNLREQRAPRF